MTVCVTAIVSLCVCGDDRIACIIVCLGAIVSLIHPSNCSLKLKLVLAIASEAAAMASYLANEDSFFNIYHCVQ